MTKRATPRKKRHIVAEFYAELKEGKKTKTRIHQDLALNYGVESKTIQRWVSEKDRETQDMTAQLEQRVTNLTSGYELLHEDYEERHPPEIPQISNDGRLLV